MSRKLFEHRTRKREDTGRIPGKPYNSSDADDEGPAPKNFEEPGYAKHSIRYPEDEPHMKGKPGKKEMSMIGKNRHMKIPKLTEDKMPATIKREHMMMDDPHHDDPKPLFGSLVQNVGPKGVKQDIGQEKDGPNDMQKDDSKESRKKMVVAIARRKMKKKE